MLAADAVVAVDDQVPERVPVIGRIACLLEQLALAPASGSSPSSTYPAAARARRDALRACTTAP